MKHIINKITTINFDFERIKTEVYSILDEHNNIPQIGLTYSGRAITEQDKILDSVGSIKDYETNARNFNERDFVHFNEKYIDTELYNLYNALGSIGRFRIMNMSGPSCYTIHKDLTKRYHLVIDTNENCLFLFPSLGKMMHIPADGSLYLVETRIPHTFVNGSRSRRIHLVLDSLPTILGN